MRLRLEQVSKRYSRNWIIYECTTTLQSPGCVAIVGDNGSGKSTLLKMMSGYLTPSRGKIIIESDAGNVIEPLAFARMLSFCAPYIDYIDELSLQQHFDFHRLHRPLRANMGAEAFFQAVDLESHKKARVGDLSSGMRQRFMLGLAVFSESQVFLFDEPSSFLDKHWSAWLLQQLSLISEKHLCIVATNQTPVVEQADQVIDVERLNRV